MARSGNVVFKSLYRSLLRQARRIDGNPALKFLVIAKPKFVFDRERNAVINFNYDEHDLNNFVERFTGGGQYYRPENSITQLLGDAFRTEDKVNESAMVSTSFSALRFLADINDMNQHLVENWDQPHRVMQRDASEVRGLKQITDFAAVECFAGRLLLTHPVSCIDQDEFHRAVILLHEEANEPDTLAGYIINKPNTRLKLKNLWNEVAEKFPELGECDVWTGGVMQGSAFLHTCHGIEGSYEVDANIFLHPIKSNNDDVLKQLKNVIKEERTSVKHIKFLHGVCGWWRKQLLSELERSVWFLTDPPEEGIKHLLDDKVSEPQHLWQSLLARFGGEYEKIAASPDFPRKILQRLSQGQKDAIYQLLKES